MSKSSARWYFNFSKWSPSYEDLILATSCVQPEEKVCLGKFVFKKDFKSSLIGRLLMRKFVSEACEMGYNNVKFIRDERGRPMVENLKDKSVIFNVSHQGDFTVLAGEVGDLLLGVDVMKLEYTGGKPISEFFRIMNRNFSTLEWKQIYSNLSEKDQVNTFCRLWSLKESYVKALGVGITVRLDDLSFKIFTPLSKGTFVRDTELYVKGKKLEEWHFEETLIQDDHCVAVATNKKIDGESFSEIDFVDLMKNAVPLQAQDQSYCLEYFKKVDKT